MGETGDWGNMAGFLEGLKVAKRKLKGWQLEKMIRRANDGGKQGVVYDMLRRADKTGVGLWDLGVCREVMRGAVLHGTQRGWSKDGVEKGVRYAESIWELMWESKHRDEQKKVGVDPRGRPEIIGVMVLMHAVKAAKFRGANNEGAMVGKYAELMLERWQNSRDVMGVDGKDWSDANYKLLIWAPVWQGMKLAQQVVGAGTPLGKRLGEKLSQDVEPLLQKSQAIISGHPLEEGTRRGLKMYEYMVQVSL